MIGEDGEGGDPIMSAGRRSEGEEHWVASLAVSSPVYLFFHVRHLRCQWVSYTVTTDHEVQQVPDISKTTSNISHCGWKIHVCMRRVSLCVWRGFCVYEAGGLSPVHYMYVLYHQGVCVQEHMLHNVGCLSAINDM